MLKRWFSVFLFFQEKVQPNQTSVTRRWQRSERHGGRNAPLLAVLVGKPAPLSHCVSPSVQRVSSTLWFMCHLLWAVFCSQRSDISWSWIEDVILQATRKYFKWNYRLQGQGVSLSAPPSAVAWLCLWLGEISWKSRGGFSLLYCGQRRFSM